MAERKYTLGLDYGTESVRALLVDVATGEEVATAVYSYPDGVIDATLPGTGAELPPDWALQHPRDYLSGLQAVVPAVLREAGVAPAQVIGLGVDFTSCTMLPATADGTPLCLLPQFAAEPHAWVKLWKHHAAQPEADRLNAIAASRGEKFLDRYGGKISSEWFFPKVWQILDEAPQVFQAADRLIEGGDWIVWQLTGTETRNSCTAGYKALWSKREGFPGDDFFAALDPRLRSVVDDKMSRTILPIGGKAGELTPRLAELTGLAPGTAVAAANVDAHVAIPAATITGPGRMLMIMGTSVCHMVLGSEALNVPGICGVVEDGILPGFFGYEAGQSAVGDIFAWFTRHLVPKAYEDEAATRGISTHQLLAEKAAALRIGESGLLALDWNNGNRSVLVDTALSGLLLGQTLDTKPEEIYRALIEATAFGTRLIIESFQDHGVSVDQVFACGGLPERNEFLMQVFSDVTGRRFGIARSAQTCALGSAMFGALAAGRARGGYDTIEECVARMAGLKDRVYTPDPAAHQAYGALYREYVALHDYFGRAGNDVMKRLKALKAAASA